MHNNQIIDTLPVNDGWPPLSKEMFAFTNNTDQLIPGPHLDYTGRLLHFGASFKSIEHEWNDWKVKFETLLTKLYWLDAHVHLKTEYSDVDSFEWTIDLRKWSIESDTIPPINSDHWVYKGADAWYTKSTRQKKV